MTPRRPHAEPDFPSRPASSSTGRELARDPYLGATEAELSTARTRRRTAAQLAPTVLFPHRGSAVLRPGTLELGGWHPDGSPLLLHRADIAAADRRYTGLYGRLTGGPLGSGAPLLLVLAGGGTLYLLLNRRALSERTDNPRWCGLLLLWLAGGGV